MPQSSAPKPARVPCWIQSTGMDGHVCSARPPRRRPRRCSPHRGSVARAGTRPPGCPHGALCVAQDGKGEHNHSWDHWQGQFSTHPALGCDTKPCPGVLLSWAQSVTPKQRVPALVPPSWPCSSCCMNKQNGLQPLVPPFPQQILESTVHFPLGKDTSALFRC